MSRSSKKIILILVDALLIAATCLFSYRTLIEILSTPLDRTFVDYVPTYFVMLILYILFGLAFKVFSRINRYIDIYTVLSVSYALIAAFLTQWFIVGNLLGIEARFRFIVLCYILSMLILSISRFAWALFSQIRNHEKRHTRKLQRTLVVGAGEAASIFFKSLEMDDAKYNIVGIVDDNPNKKGTYLHKFRVFGELDEISRIIRDRNIQHVIIAIPTLPAERIEEIVRACNALGVSVNRMPHAQDILINGFDINRLREVSVSDLLGRDVVKLDVAGLKTELSGKVILITGAGGSIGSEICRQVIRFRPKKLLLLGQGENSIYHIHRELEANYGHRTEIVPIIANVKDRERIFKLMQKHKPNMVYHAAAHKHVPLMEVNPLEAVKNNVYGTKNVAEAAKEAGVSNFVMVSTDKAVNPTNVMGATKRIAEMIVTSMSEKDLKPGEPGTKLSAVRFGNVLGSRGSVIPLFREQIEKGGPITLTDRRMTRYFMTIPEASRLVVQSGMLSRGGEVFVLDMGEPVRIMDLAKKMITLSGFTEKEIKIVETGIRPGEKLFEELLLNGEMVKENIFEKIFVGQVATLPLDEVLTFVEGLEDTPDLGRKLVAFANQECITKF